MTVENEHFVAEALRVVEEADGQGIRLRILGSLAYRLHCPENIELFAKMERGLTDIDFAAERKQAREIRALISSKGYVEDAKLTMATEGGRYYFEHPETGLGIDVFMDELYFCHPIPFKQRLHLDKPTIPLADLVLEKMQIVEINLKDVKDTLVLLLEHDVGGGEHGKETVDGEYIAGLLSNDWGFYYTVTQNLQKVENFIPEFDVIPKHQGETISKRIAQLVEAIESAPKTAKWKLRARIGRRRRWYQEVNEKGVTF
ncbi:MAG: hypothetical protein H0V97_03240 [Actinobacteria bacterium]|nr:hypothetical protein [Actinomycetota bacterium]